MFIDSDAVGSDELWVMDMYGRIRERVGAQERIGARPQEQGRAGVDSERAPVSPGTCMTPEATLPAASGAKRSARSMI